MPSSLRRWRAPDWALFPLQSVCGQPCLEKPRIGDALPPLWNRPCRRHHVRPGGMHTREPAPTAKESRGLLREGIDVKFGFVAKHRGIWPRNGCAGRSGSRGVASMPGLTRPPSDEDVGAKVRASFLASDRTYGARRVRHDMMAEGVSCGLHRIQRLMRRRARPQLRSVRSQPQMDR